MTMIKHHLDPATLMSYSAGTLGEALSAVTAAHLEICPHCRRELDLLDMLGGAVLDSLPMHSDKIAAPAVTKLSATLPEGARRGKRAVGADTRNGSVSGRLMLGEDLARVPWRRLAPGVWHHKLTLSQGAEGDLRLLKIAQGQRMPEHGHGGAELTLVLSGAYSDAAGRYGAGDIQDCDADDEHIPVADPEAGCICLIASERPARFKGFFARLVQPLTGM